MLNLVPLTSPLPPLVCIINTLLLLEIIQWSHWVEEYGLVPGRKRRVSPDPGLPMPGNANAILGVGLSGDPRLIMACDFPLWELFQCLAGLLIWRLENRSNSGMTSCTSGSVNTEGLAFSSTVKESGPLGPPALQMLHRLNFEVACWDGQVYLLLGQGSQGRV